MNPAAIRDFWVVAKCWDGFLAAAETRELGLVVKQGREESKEIGRHR